jgi:hypothetical protein
MRPLIAEVVFCAKAGAVATMAIVEMAAQIAVLENSDQDLLLIVKTPQKNAKMRNKPLTKMYIEEARKRLAQTSTCCVNARYRHIEESTSCQNAALVQEPAAPDNFNEKSICRSSKRLRHSTCAIFMPALLFFSQLGGQV